VVSEHPPLNSLGMRLQQQQQLLVGLVTLQQASEEASMALVPLQVQTVLCGEEACTLQAALRKCKHQP